MKKTVSILAIGLALTIFWGGLIIVGASADTVDDDNPYGDETLVVEIDDSEAERNVTPVVTDSLEYWEQNSEQYADYPIEYEVDADEHPDVRIVWVDNLEKCDEMADESIAGCADLVEDTAPGTALVEVESGLSKEQATETLKHELGHTLGLRHGDAPQDVMSAT